jgi:hypothetical protein
MSVQIRERCHWLVARPTRGCFAAQAGYAKGSHNHKKANSRGKQACDYASDVDSYSFTTGLDISWNRSAGAVAASFSTARQHHTPVVGHRHGASLWLWYRTKRKGCALSNKHFFSSASARLLPCRPWFLIDRLVFVRRSLLVRFRTFQPLGNAYDSFRQNHRLEGIQGVAASWSNTPLEVPRLRLIGSQRFSGSNAIIGSWTHFASCVAGCRPLSDRSRQWDLTFTHFVPPAPRVMWPTAIQRHYIWMFMEAIWPPTRTPEDCVHRPKPPQPITVTFLQRQCCFIWF